MNFVIGGFMKKLLLIPALCLVCYSCGSGDCCQRNKPVESQETSADWVITTKVKTEELWRILDLRICTICIR